jgi:hypothetical protein
MVQLAWVAVLAMAQNVEVFGEEVGVRIVRQGDELVEELLAKDADGKFRIVLVSPTHIRVAKSSLRSHVTGLSQVGPGLFDEAPGFAFDTVQRDAGVITLSKRSGGFAIERRIEVPQKGKIVRVTTEARFDQPRSLIRFFLAGYAFAPDGQPLSQAGRPDSTFVPGLRPRPNQVIGDHQFRAPVAAVQKGPLAALLLPDLRVLEDNRPLPTILDLDAASGVVDAPIISYGFADHRLDGHVYFRHDASLVRNVPNELILVYDILLDAQAEPFAAYRQAVPYHWERYGRDYFDRVLPQAMPFEEYARACYPAALSGGRLPEGQDPKLPSEPGWFEHELDGHIVAGVPAGWGYRDGWVSWQCWFNNLRSAWGLRWWGNRLGERDWVGKADKMLNLALAAPMDRGAIPTTYLSKTREWKGTLIAPDPSCYYDLTNMAWKGIWLLRWLEFDDCPRRDEIARQCHEMAELMIRHQNADGSFPTWLTKDHQVVPILDASAQSALPTWFLAELARSPGQATGDISRLRSAAERGASFLLDHVVDGQYWYDFETFFSCSPKACHQRNLKVDHEAMRDPHTLQAPQNTLSMQWAAEALLAVEALQGTPQGSALRAGALKALDMMVLYQNVWPITYRGVAYTFGGFGVQNSDGEYLDARQAQFGATLCDFGAFLGRRDYFERGVAATRASMTLINHPLHEKMGLYPNPNYPYGLQPENCGHGGLDRQDGRTGFDWGEGSGLTSMAWLLHKYGERYEHPSGWSVLIDGGWKGKEWWEAHQEKQILQDPSFDFAEWRMKGWTVVGDFAEVPTWSTRVDFGASRGQGFIGTAEDGRGGYDDVYTGTITSPPFRVSKPIIRLLVGGGSGEGVYVELVDADSGQRLFIERGRNRERMDERAWDVSQLGGRRLQIRVVDRERGGWGHINVARVRAEDR